jgi:hypothetical protein
MRKGFILLALVIGIVLQFQNPVILPNGESVRRIEVKKDYRWIEPMASEKVYIKFLINGIWVCVPFSNIRAWWETD